MPRQIQTTNIHTHSGTHKLLFRDKVVVNEVKVYGLLIINTYAKADPDYNSSYL